MSFSLRVVVYLAGGGLLMTWIDPPHGLIRYGLLLALILGFAYVDHLLRRRRLSLAQRTNVVSLGQYRKQKQRRHGGETGRERRVLRPVYHSVHFTEVDGLLAMLRAEGLHPMMVTHSREEPNRVQYEVRLPDAEIEAAQPLIERYLMKSAQPPS